MFYNMKLNIQTDAVIPVSLISISNGNVVPPIGSVRLMVARKSPSCSGTISGALSETVAPEKKQMSTCNNTG